MRTSRSRRRRVPPELAALVISRWGNDCWLAMPGCTIVSDTTDHIIAASAGGPTIPQNLRRACRHCNSLRKDRTVSGYGARFHAVIGPPCGGKSTYVDLHRQPGDVVLDMDAIAAALVPGLPDRHGQPSWVRDMAMSAWYSAYAKAARITQPVTVWIVRTLPSTPRSPMLLDEWVSLDYQVTVCDPGKQEVMDRHASERAGHDMELAGIRQWYRSGLTQQAVDARLASRRRRLAELGLASMPPPAAARPRW